MKTVKTSSGATFECGPRSIRFAKQPSARFALGLLDQINLGQDIIARQDILYYTRLNNTRLDEYHVIQRCKSRVK